MSEPGLQEKFKVERLRPSSRGIDHGECRYFVLDPEHDKHARRALYAYASDIEDEEPELAHDLYRWLAELAVKGKTTLT